ncbi:hypothetical protein EIP86_005548 [Pleurotus ostreatoroseus]|nr:hypothetical protein EIP86_005548 [Pleurotus ostreatoroseus]
MLNPVFSINHMRYMAPIFYQMAHRLRDAIEGDLESSGTSEVDMLDWMGRMALELIGQGGLGYSFDPLVASTQNSFGEALKALLPTLGRCAHYIMVIPQLVKIGPASFRRRLVELFPDPNVRAMKKIVDTMEARAKEILEDKRAALRAGDEALMQQIGEGKDIMSILMRSNMSADPKDRLTEEELVAQMSTLVFAATDTTSNALARTLDLLSTHLDVQEKLRAEILEAGHGEDIPYDQLVDNLPYLDAVCRETLRLHPPASLAAREALKDIVLPFSEPIQGLDGTMIDEVVVPKGTMVFVGIRSANRNKAIWGEDALEWKPERWLSPMPHAVKEAKIPGVYMNL